MKWTRRSKLILAAAAVLVAAVPTWYLASPLFIVTRGAEAPPAGFSTVVATGSLMDGEPGHHAEGQVTLLGNGSSFVLRFANFSVTNGPDIEVFLSRGPRVASNDVSLGDVKATQGSSNYAVPTGIDPRDFAYVVIWCVPFSVQFGYAALSFAWAVRFVSPLRALRGTSEDRGASRFGGSTLAISEFGTKGTSPSALLGTRVGPMRFLHRRHPAPDVHTQQATGRPNLSDEREAEIEMFRFLLASMKKRHSWDRIKGAIATAIPVFWIVLNLSRPYVSSTLSDPFSASIAAPVLLLEGTPTIWTAAVSLAIAGFQWYNIAFYQRRVIPLVRAMYERALTKRDPRLLTMLGEALRLRTLRESFRNAWRRLFPE